MANVLIHILSQLNKCNVQHVRLDLHRVVICKKFLRSKLPNPSRISDSVLSPSQNFITWTLARVHKENALQKGANRQERERQLQNLVKRSSHP